MQPVRNGETNPIPFALLTRDVLNNISQTMSVDTEIDHLNLTEDASVVADHLIQNSDTGQLPFLPAIYPYPTHWSLFHRWVVYDCLVSLQDSLSVKFKTAIQFWLSDPELPILIPLMPSAVPTVYGLYENHVLDAFKSASISCRSCILSATQSLPYEISQRERGLVGTRLQFLALLDRLELLPNFPQTEDLWVIR